ncbi:MAG: sugar-transfer associated ATP-grasp domain-containing protein [Candidatus Pelethousia sp.]|nr:sugar-transfer associated ATP-grasp domain-containing protein [Candidatus Pelethousia sp.]
MISERMKRIAYAGSDLIMKYKWKAPLVALTYLYVRKKYGMGYGGFRSIDYISLSKEQRESFLGIKEYFHRCFRINPYSELKVLRDKRTIINRLPHYLGRECLIEDFADDTAFLEFSKRHTSFFAKKNFTAAGKGIRVFRDIHTEEDRKGAYRICKEEDLTIIEQFISQHQVLSTIYPHVVNTIRIHTVRGSDGIQIVLSPELYIPSGGERDTVHTTEDRYSLFIDLSSGRLWNKAFTTDRLGIIKHEETSHRDTGAIFGNICIPYWEEVKAMVIDAASCIPELAYIGWDVAITPTGPVIIEGNAISGALGNYQIQKSLTNGGYGVRKEYEDMFSLAEKVCEAGR